MSEHKHTFRNMADKLLRKDSARENEDPIAPKETSINAMGTHKEDSEASSPSRMETAPLVESSTARNEDATVHSRTFAPIVETHVNPTVLDQTYRKETVVEVQPVIHREVVEPEVHVIEQHIYEKVPAVGPTIITRQAIIEETVVPRIIEEIQPVLHRDVPAPYITHVEQHISEHEVRPTVYTKEVTSAEKAWTAEEAISRGFVAPYKAPVAAEEPTVHSHRAATVVDAHLNATLVEESVRPEKVIEIQPIIHREIDAPEIHYIEKHMYESVPLTGPRSITKQAIVEEEIHPKIIEEIVPIVHREVPQTVIEKRERHVTEKVTAPTIQTKEVIHEHRVGEAVSILPGAATLTLENQTPRVVSATAEPSLTSNVHGTIVEETARPEEVVEVQPIVHRVVDAPEVHVIEQHVQEIVPSVGPKQVTKQAIVEETIVPTVREEVNPIVHREVPVAVVEHVEEHIKENVKLDSTKTKEVYVDGKKVLDADISLAKKEMSNLSLKEEDHK